MDRHNIAEKRGHTTL